MTTYALAYLHGNDQPTVFRHGDDATDGEIITYITNVITPNKIKQIVICEPRSTHENKTAFDDLATLTKRLKS